MSDLIELALGGALVLVGFVLGRIHRPRRKPEVPMCSCGHPLSAHERDTDRCVATVKQEWWEGGVHEAWVPCACVRYTGPQHLADVWLPPVAAPERDR